MKKLIIGVSILAIVAIVLTCRSLFPSTPKVTYTLEPLPYYDSVGNLYTINMKEVYDHVPTSEDSIQFNKKVDSVFDSMLKELADSTQN